MKTERRGGNPKRISELIGRALQELRPKAEKFQHIEYNIPSTGAPPFRIGLS